MEGKIYSINAGKYYICDKADKMHILPAAGVLRHNKIKPLVGDNVIFDENKHISEILPRKNSLIRPKVANIDYVIIVMSIKEPNFSTYLVDKYMAFIEANNLTPILFLSKCDLDPNEANEYKKQYEKLGYEVYEISYKTDEWVKNIAPVFANKTNVLMGQSGVGKTTIVNKITNSDYETQSISKNANRGKHTTRIVQIVKALNGELIDTPGFSSLDIHFTKSEISRSYKQFAELAKLCKFKTCLHCNEPEDFCNVKLAIKNNLIPEFRYLNYLKILKEIKDE